MQARTVFDTFRNPNESLAGVARRPLEREDILALTGTLTEDEWRFAVDCWLIDGLSVNSIAHYIKVRRLLP